MYFFSKPTKTDNMIYAIEQARKAKPFNPMIDMWAVQVMAQLYVYYLQTLERGPRFADQNYQYCVKYYKQIFEPIAKRVSMKSFKGIFAQVLTEQAPNMSDIVPEMTIYQFVEKLKKE